MPIRKNGFCGVSLKALLETEHMPDAEKLDAQTGKNIKSSQVSFEHEHVKNYSFFSAATAECHILIHAIDRETRTNASATSNKCIGKKPWKQRYMQYSVFIECTLQECLHNIRIYT